MRDEAKISFDAKKAEAISRMETLNFKEVTIQGFREEGLIPLFVHAVDEIYGLKKGTVDRITTFEDHHKALVYAVIFTPTALGDMESYLFVSDYEEEWDMDRYDLADGYPMTWTENLTYPQCSEFGSIAITHTKSGGLKRVS